MKFLSKGKNDHLLAWKIKVDAENISITSADFKKEINLDTDENNLDDLFFK